MMYQVKYRIKDRFLTDKQGNQRINPDHKVEVMTGFWCSEKKKTLSLGTLPWKDFYKLTGIKTGAAFSGRGIIKESIEMKKFVILRNFLKTQNK